MPEMSMRPKGKRPRGKRNNKQQHAAAQQEKLMNQIETAETRIKAIDELFCQPNYYEQTPPDEVKTLETERTELERDLAYLTAEWERSEEAIGVAN